VCELNGAPVEAAYVSFTGWTPGVNYDVAVLNASGAVVFYSFFREPDAAAGYFGTDGLTETLTVTVYEGSVPAPYDPATRTILAQASFTPCGVV
jgi:hypothetical protein